MQSASAVFPQSSSGIDALHAASKLTDLTSGSDGARSLSLQRNSLEQTRFGTPVLYGTGSRRNGTPPCRTQSDPTHAAQSLSVTYSVVTASGALERTSKSAVSSSLSSLRRDTPSLVSFSNSPPLEDLPAQPSPSYVRFGPKRQRVSSQINCLRVHETLGSPYEAGQQPPESPVQESAPVQESTPLEASVSVQESATEARPQANLTQVNAWQIAVSFRIRSKREATAVSLHIRNEDDDLVLLETSAPFYQQLNGFFTSMLRKRSRVLNAVPWFRNDSHQQCLSRWTISKLASSWSSGAHHVYACSSCAATHRPCVIRVAGCDVPTAILLPLPPDDRPAAATSAQLEYYVKDGELSTA